MTDFAPGDLVFHLVAGSVGIVLETSRLRPINGGSGAATVSWPSGIRLTNVSQLRLMEPVQQESKKVTPPVHNGPSKGIM